jgi:hypothetical protein
MKVRYRILSSQKYGGPSACPLRSSLGALDEGLTGGSFGNSSILGGHTSKADSYHFIRNQAANMLIGAVALAHSKLRVMCRPLAKGNDA